MLLEKLTSVAGKSAQILGLGKFQCGNNIVRASSLDGVGDVVAKGARNTAVREGVAGLIGEVRLHDGVRRGNTSEIREGHQRSSRVLTELEGSSTVP